MADYLLREDGFKFLHEDEDGFILRETSSDAPATVGFHFPFWGFGAGVGEGSGIQPGDEVQVIVEGGIECHVLINGDTGAVPVRVVIASPKQITVRINGETGASPIHVTI